jgi:hypothetical protein
MPVLLDETLAIKALMVALDKNHVCISCNKIKAIQKTKSFALKNTLYIEACKLAILDKKGCPFGIMLRSHIPVVMQAVQAGQLNQVKK